MNKIKKSLSYSQVPETVLCNFCNPKSHIYLALHQNLRVVSYFYFLYKIIYQKEFDMIEQKINIKLLILLLLINIKNIYAKKFLTNRVLQVLLTEFINDVNRIILVPYRVVNNWDQVPKIQIGNNYAHTKGTCNVFRWKTNCSCKVNKTIQEFQSYFSIYYRGGIVIVSFPAANIR